MEKGYQKEKQKQDETQPAERPIASLYPVIDNDLARDNVENDLAFADLQDM